jgi:pimeloyl-ACP methyl ester carboxylesterase
MSAVLFDAQGTAYTDGGAGPAVLLIRGVGLSHRIWSAVTPLILTGRHVIALDMLGHGASPLPREGAPLDDYAQQAFRLLDHLGIASFAVVGFSMGALVAQQMALDQPSRVREIALVSGAHARNDEQRAAIRKRSCEFAERGLEPFIPGAIERWLTPAFRQAHPELEAGKLRAFGITTAAGSRTAPDVAPVARSKELAGFGVGVWWGLFAPAKTPRPILEKTERDIITAMVMEKVRSRLEQQSITPDARPAAALAKFMQTEAVSIRKVVEAAGIKAE